MNWPFTTRARLDDALRSRDELKQELLALRENHERVLDQVNFRSTGFHLYPRFDKREEEPVTGPIPKVDALNDPKPEQLSGARVRAALRSIEADKMAKYETEQRAQLAIREAGMLRAAQKMESALSNADERSQA